MPTTTTEADLEQRTENGQDMKEVDLVAMDYFREDALNVSRAISAAYRVTNHGGSELPEAGLSYPTQLAYLRARNIGTVSQLLNAACYNKAQQEVIDKLSEEALKFHNWGRDVYWRAIAEVQDESLKLAARENASGEQITALCMHRLYSQEKINEIEKQVREGGLDARFPGLVTNPNINLNPFELFEEIRKYYDPKNRNGKFPFCKIIELAYKSAVDTLALKACFDSKGYVTFEQAKDQYYRVRIAHQERGLAFWEPVHEADLFCLERATREKMGDDEIKRLDEKSRMSEEKLIKLDTRVGATGEEELNSGKLFQLMKRIVDNTIGRSFTLDSKTREELLELVLQSAMDEANRNEQVMYEQMKRQLIQ
jgi:hypothetical protein